MTMASDLTAHISMDIFCVLVVSSTK